MNSDNGPITQPAFETGQTGTKKPWYKKGWGIFIIVSLAFILILVVALAIYFGNIFYLVKTGQLSSQVFSNTNLSSSSPEKTPVNNLPTMAAADSPSIGPKNAKVVVVEFADFQCPACIEVYPVVKKVLADYGNQIRFVFRNLPNTDSHPGALIAALAGQCAYRQGKFWEMYDKIFSNPDNVTEANLKTYALQIGLDSIQFGTCLQDNFQVKRIEQDVTDAFAAGVTATPTFFINGGKVQGAIPLANFEKIIGAALAAADSSSQ